MSFIELLKDHALILVATRSLQDIAQGAQPAPAAAFGALRRLARLLDAHLRAEAAFIRQDGEDRHPEFSALADAHDQHFDALVSEWQTYLHAWDEAAIGIDWPSFAAATHAILERLAEQVEAENRSLYPTALKHGLIRLLPDGMDDRAEVRPAA